MIESITIVTITILLLAYFRPGKTPPLENPLSIVRAGKYEIKLEAKLNFAQPFLESLAERIRPLIENLDGSAVQYFVVQDKQVKAHGSDRYLLAVCCRDHMIYFYGANPKPSSPSEYLDVIKAYSIDSIRDFSSTSYNKGTIEQIIHDAVWLVAKNRNVVVAKLSTQNDD
jgi:hypothetical protein